MRTFDSVALILRVMFPCLSAYSNDRPFLAYVSRSVAPGAVASFGHASLQPFSSPLSLHLRAQTPDRRRSARVSRRLGRDRRQHRLAVEAGLEHREQQRELLAILDRAASLQLNAIIFQVRPGADALYARSRAVVAVPHRAAGARAGAAVGPARLRGRAGAQARARAARVVQSVSRRVHARHAATRGRTSVADESGARATVRPLSLDGSRRSPRCGVARCARSSTS